MTPDNESSAIISGSLVINCPEMTLTKNELTNQTTFTGAGHIDVTAGHINLKLFADCNKPLSNVRLDNIRSTNSGLLYDKTEYYRLEAIDSNGGKWTAEQILLSYEGCRTFPTKSVVTATLSEIRRPRPSFRNENSVTLIIADQKESEWITLIGEWSAGAPYTGYRFDVSTLPKDHIAIKLQSNSTLPTDCAMRMYEALSFISGSVLKVRITESVREGVSDTRYHGITATLERGYIFRPLEMRNSLYAEAVRSLMVRYMQFAHITTLETLWHPCSAHLSHARQASTNSLDAWIVGSSVALEGIATLFPVDVNKEYKVITAIQKNARKLVAKSGASKGLNDRVNGLLGQLRNPRVVDRLNPLIAAGIIDRKSFKAWSDSRHKAVHTSKMNQDDFSDPMLQEAVNRVHKIHTLINKLVFILIGYTGPYIDYGELGYPTKMF